MFNELTGLGLGIITFAVMIGIGSVVLFNFGNATANCSTGYTYNTTSQLCTNGSGSTVNPSQSTQNTNYLLGQIGQSGLAGWTPAIIALSIGLLFLGAFLFGKGRKSRGRY